jgi:hypothetical protein
MEWRRLGGEERWEGPKGSGRMLTTNFISFEVE